MEAHRGWPVLRGVVAFRFMYLLYHHGET